MPEASRGMMPQNRISGCWHLVFADDGADVAWCTPLAAAVETARRDTRKTGRRIVILATNEPHPDA
jgi:hypothetical protein